MSADLGHRLAELRTGNKITKEELGKKLFVKTKEISRWENGESSPDGEQLIKLSQIYHMPIDEILLNFDTESSFEYPENYANVIKPSGTNGGYANNNNGGKIIKSFNWYAFPYPVLVLLVYLIAGFRFNSWHPAWLLFLTIPIYYEMVAMSRAKSFRAKANIFPYPVLCVIFYLSLGFDHNLWHPAWILFITIPIYYMFVNSIKSR